MGKKRFPWANYKLVFYNFDAFYKNRSISVWVYVFTVIWYFQIHRLLLCIPNIYQKKQQKQNHHKIASLTRLFIALFQCLIKCHRSFYHAPDILRHIKGQCITCCFCCCCMLFVSGCLVQSYSTFKAE